MSGRTRAAILMVCSATAFAFMGAFVKAAAATPLLDKVIVRNLVTLGIAAAIALRQGHPLLGRRSNQPLLLARSLLGVGGVTCYFYAIDHLLLADATMLTTLSPFFVAVFAALFLGERAPKTVIAAMVIGFLGGLLIVKPRFDISVLPALVGLASGAFAGAAYTALRALRSREAPATIIFHFSLVTVLGLAPVAAADLRLPQGMELAWLLGIGVSAAIGQFGLTLAYRHAPAAEVSVYASSMMVVAAALGFVFWSELPDALSLVGGALILLGSTMAYTARRGAEPAP
jgi:drug/metabolite transporter (DMT)-like permease